jgi:hypothetical protein
LTESLPTLIAGPILRHTDSQRIVWWLITSVAVDIKPLLADADNEALDLQNPKTNQETFCVGQNAFIQLITLEASGEQNLLESGVLYHYDLLAHSQSISSDKDEYNTEKSILEGALGLTYEGYSRPNFRFNHNLTKVTHGSCRKPHFHGEDALPQLDHIVPRYHANDWRSGVFR